MTFQRCVLFQFGVGVGALALCLGSPTAFASDLTLPVGGRVSVELVFADAAFSNTMSIVAPGAVIGLDAAGRPSTGCNLEPSGGLGGTPLLSEKRSQRGCRADLDFDPGTPGIQPFPAGSIVRFGMCAQTNSDPACEFVWSSDPSSNSDGFDHVRTTPIHDAEFPGQIFQLAWEDQANGGDRDFNDLVAVVRVVNDSDGDGLWDDWERFGVDTDGDGTIDLDLPALGANPRHKDLFIEIDYMDCAIAGGDCPAGDTHSHRPKAAAIAATVAAFANAPVPNPDGTNGITAHIDVSNAIPHQKFLFLPGACFSGGAGIGNFDTVKADPANFGATNPRRFAYRYNIWGHLQDPSSTSSGCGELPGNDFLVTLGGFDTGGAADLDGDGLDDRQMGTISQQAGTLIHELGHTLGLQHGGGDGINYKPNFISLMNYWFQLGGIPPLDPDGPGPLTGRLSYSSATLATLTETNLSEPAGVGAGTDNSIFYCPSFVSRTISGNNPANWNCNAVTTDLGVSADVNGDRICITAGNDGILQTVAAGDDVVQPNPLLGGQAITDGANRICDTAPLAGSDDAVARAVGNLQTPTLYGFDDWTAVQLPFQNGSAFDDGAPSARFAQLDIDVKAYESVIRPDLVVSETSSPASVTTGGSVTFTISVSNKQPEGARDVKVLYTLPAGITPLSCAATNGGNCTTSGGGPAVIFASVAGGAGATITLVGQVNCDVPNAAVLTSAVQASGAMPDANPSDNQATASVVVVNPPPVFTAVPGALTISSCAAPNIGQATATDQCGSATVTNDAPVKYPLGPTTVTWTAKDAAGGATTATQIVTAILADDASCCPAGSKVLVGTPNNDTLVGGTGSDCILGLGGQDAISGGGGNDFISGGAGDDVLTGGDGDDWIYGGSGQDTLNGNVGNDLLFGGDGDDICHGGDGDDRVFGEANNDRLFGDGGNDLLSGGTGDDALDGGPGVDVCDGGAGHNTLASCP